MQLRPDRGGGATHRIQLHGVIAKSHRVRVERVGRQSEVEKRRRTPQETVEDDTNSREITMSSAALGEGRVRILDQDPRAGAARRIMTLKRFGVPGNSRQTGTETNGDGLIR